MKLPLLLRLLAVLVLIIVIIVLWNTLDLEKMRHLFLDPDNHCTVALILLGLFMSKSVLFFLPAKVLYIFSGMALPLYIAVFLNALGIFLEISLTYFYGYMLGNTYVERLMSRYAKFKKLLEYNMEQDLKVTFLLRLAPVAIEPVSLMMGASGNHYWRYVLASLMGIAPKLLFFTMVGNALIYPVNVYTILGFVSIILLWGLLLWLLKRWMPDGEILE